MVNKIKVNAANDLIEVALNEFLDRGYKNSSVRQIAQKAGVSTYLIYDRFTDKLGLFKAVVVPAQEKLIDAYSREMELFNKTCPDAPYEDMEIYVDNRADSIIDTIYDYIREYKIMINSPFEAEFDSLIEKLISIQSKQIIHYFDMLNIDIKSRVSPKLWQIISHSLFTGIFEVVRHDMSREDAHIFNRQLLKYNMHGFQAFLA